MSVQVQGPDGNQYQFPDGTDKNAAIAYFKQKGIGVSQSGPVDMSKVPGADPGMQSPQQAAGIKTPQMHGTAVDYGKVLAVGDLAKGAVKGAGHTMATLNSYAAKVPGVGSLIPADAQDQSLYTPNNTAQKIGYGAEQTGEFLAPIGAEGKIATKGAELLPKLGRFANPVSRIAASALSTGAVNKAQGGNFSTGAEMGGAGGLFSEGLRVAAPIIAESAIGVRGADRGAAITPGDAILNETTGVNARSIANQAKQKMGEYTTQRDALLNNAPPVDLTPARNVASNAQTVAASRNNPETIKRVGQISDLLSYEGGKAPAPQPASPKVISGFGPSSPLMPPTPSGAIPTSVPATRANALKQGLGDLKGSWNPATPNDFAEGTIAHTYGTLNEGIENSAPGSSALNDKISSLYPVANKANATDLNASTLQRILGRWTRPTGALVGMTGGAYEGERRGGIPGAIIGGTVGLAAPELIGSPTAQMLMARRFSAGMTPTIRALTGGGLQANRQSLYTTPQK